MPRVDAGIGDEFLSMDEEGKHDALGLGSLLEGLADVQDAVYIKDRDGRYLMVNVRAAAVIGRSPGEMLGLTDEEVFGPPGTALARADLELMGKGAAHTVEEEPVVIDDEMRTFLTTKAPLRDVSGEVIGLVAISTDISERKRLEDQLRRRETQLAEAQAVAGVGSWEWDVAGDDVTWSPEFYEMLGMDPRDVQSTLEGFLTLIHPDDRAAAEGALNRALAGSADYAVAHRMIRADGEELMMLCRGQVHRDVDGSPLRIVGASLDLSDYMGVANALRTEHEHLLAAEELAGTGSFEWDVEADEVIWSAGMYRMFGLRPEEFDGSLGAYLLLVHPEDRDARRTDLERLLEEGDALTSEHRIRRGDRSTRWIQSRISVERDPTGDPRRLLGVCRDITDERAG